MKINICSIFRDDPPAKIKPDPQPNVEIEEEIVTEGLHISKVCIICMHFYR